MRTDRGARTDQRQRRALQGLGPWLSPTPSKIAAYSARYGEIVLANPTLGGFTITAPRAEDHDGEIFGVKNVTTSTNTITVDAQGTELIDGAGSDSMSTAWLSRTYLASDGVWYKV